MKSFGIFILAAALASAESHPSWWAYASPEATALVGIHWDNLRNSPFADAIQGELAPTGPLGFPDLECLRNAREIVISSPELLAAEAGSFPSGTVKEQAQRAGLHRVNYHGVPLWVPEKADNLGVAQISEQVVLVATRETLQYALDQSALESNHNRQYSPLLPRAARFSQTGDLWVIAVKLPDPLASLFVPLDAEATDFEGQVSVRGGLFVQATFDAGKKDAAIKIAAELRRQSPNFPLIARGLQVTSEQTKVTVQLLVGQEELSAALHPAAPKVAPAPKPPPPAAAELPRLAVTKAIVPPSQPIEIKPPVETKLPELKPSEPKPSEPQIIRIIGLDEGTREIRVQ